MPARCLAALALVLSGGGPGTLAASDPGRPNGGFLVETSSNTTDLSNPQRPNGGFLVEAESRAEAGGSGGFLFGNGGAGGAGDGAACNSGKE